MTDRLKKEVNSKVLNVYKLLREKTYAKATKAVGI